MNRQERRQLNWSETTETVWDGEKYRLQHEDEYMCLYRDVPGVGRLIVAQMVRPKNWSTEEQKIWAEAYIGHGLSDEEA